MGSDRGSESTQEQKMRAFQDGIIGGVLRGIEEQEKLRAEAREAHPDELLELLEVCKRLMAVLQRGQEPMLGPPTDD